MFQVGDRAKVSWHHPCVHSRGLRTDVRVGSRPVCGSGSSPYTLPIPMRPHLCGLMLLDLRSQLYLEHRGHKRQVVLSEPTL